MKITIILASVLIAGSAYAQEVSNPPVVATTPAGEVNTEGAHQCSGSDLFDASRFSIVESFEFVDYNGNASDVVGFTQSVVYRYTDDTTLHLAIPFYSNGNTGFGMTGVGFDHAFIKNPCKFVEAVSIGVDFFLPTGEDDFGGSDVNIAFGFDLKGATCVEKLEWNAGFNWLANQDTAYEPVLGGLTDEDIIHVNTGLSYELSKKLAISFDYEYWNGNNDNYLSSVGPGLSWNIANNVNIDTELNFVVDNGSANNTDFSTKMGMSIKF